MHDADGGAAADLVTMQLPLEEQGPTMLDNEQAHLPALDEPHPPILHSIAHYVLFLGAVVLFWFWCPRSLVPTTALKRFQSNLTFWMEQMRANCKTMTRLDWLNFLEIFCARLVLEVFGGAGAIWGFSEATGLRTDDTVWFWRPAALTVGAVFFSRWLLQIRDFMTEHQEMSSNTVMCKEINMVRNETAIDESYADDDSDLLFKCQFGAGRRRGSYGATSSCERLPKHCKRNSLA